MLAVGEDDDQESKSASGQLEATADKADRMDCCTVPTELAGLKAVAR